VIKTVRLSLSVQKQLRKMDARVRTKLQSWVDAVQMHGLEAVRTIPGYHDEPLAGQRKGQRSVRLNKHWRAIYVVQDGEVRIALVVEVIPHSY
jgi:proteic killer suppression protein